MFIQQIYKYSNNTFNLLENLLQWSLLQTGRTVVSLKSVNMAEVIHENINLLRANAQQKEIELAWVNPDDHFVYCDRNMITTVLRNLISNAIKFTPTKGRIEVEVDVDAEYLKVIVRDSGVGISPDNQQKLFRLDSNPSTPGTDEEEGTGLGLILCKEFVEKNHGTIGVSSIEGKGSTFYFTIPRFEG
jgi:signal transduction histidine kinase